MSWLSRVKYDLETNLTLAKLQKLTMWPEGLPRAFPFFAMVAQTPDYLPLKSTTQCALSEGATAQKMLHPGLMHKGRKKIITWRPYCHFLPKRGSLTMATNHKRGSVVTMIKLFTARLEKQRFSVGTELSQMHSSGPQVTPIQFCSEPEAAVCLWSTHSCWDTIVNPTQLISLISQSFKQPSTSTILKALIPPHVRLIRKVTSPSPHH